MIEIISGISTVLAVMGVMLNNRLNRLCFVVWLASNGISAGIHINYHLWSMTARDLIFFILAIEGFFRWKRIHQNKSECVDCGYINGCRFKDCRRKK